MKIKTIGIIAKNTGEAVGDTIKTLYEYLNQQGCKVLLDVSAGDALAQSLRLTTVSRETLGQNCDLAVVVGGDGTFLSAVRSLSDACVPVLGINLGRLGFLVDISPKDMLKCFEHILAGDYVREERFLLTAQVIRNDQVIAEESAFNDVVVHIRDVARMIEFETWINGQFVYQQRSDGLVVSTPTGSTAYALSSGGPLLHSTLDAMVLVPICPHTLTNRPLVINSDNVVDVVIGEGRQSTAQVTFDGQTGVDVRPGDRISIRRKPNNICLIHPSNYDYYEILRAKLRWNEQITTNRPNA